MTVNGIAAGPATMRTVTVKRDNAEKQIAEIDVLDDTAGVVRCSIWEPDQATEAKLRGLQRGDRITADVRSLRGYQDRVTAELTADSVIL